MSVAAISHTQRISSTPFLRSVSILRAYKVHRQIEPSPARGEKPEMGVALVCRGGMAAMDMTDEADPTVKDRLERSKARANEFEPNEHN